MHHILNVKQTFIKNKFIEYDYYFLKSLRRAGSLVVEPKYGFFDTSCHSVCNSGPKSTAGKKWRLYISPQCMAYMDYQSRHKVIALQHLSLYYIHCVRWVQSFRKFSAHFS